MKSENQDRVTLRRYLLGEMEEVERAELAQRYFVGQELFDELLDVENELFDQYVRAQLSAEERARFGEYVKSLPDAASKLATAYALMEAAGEKRKVSRYRDPTGPSTLSATGWFPARVSFAHYALAAVLVGLVVAVVYLFLSLAHLRRDSQQLRVRQLQAEEVNIDLERQAQAARDAQNSREQRMRELEAELSRLHEEELKRKSGFSLASLLLTPALRSGGTPDRLSIRPETKTVSLVVPVVDEAQVGDFRIVIQTTSGRRILIKEHLKLVTTRLGRHVTVRLSSNLLTTDTYKVTLQGKSSSGLELAQDFYFHMERK